MATALKAAITALCAAIVAWHVEPTALFERLKSLRAGPLVVVALLLGVQLMISAWRWQRIAERVSAARIPFLALCRYLGASNLYGQLLPSTVGGDLVRVVMLARNVGLSGATISTLIDRITGLAVLLLLMVLLLPLLAWRIASLPAVAAIATVALAGTAVFLVIVFLSGRVPATRLPNVAARLLDLTAYLRTALFSRALAWPVIGGGLFSHAISIANIFMLGRALDVPLAFLDCLVLVPPALLLTALPISLAGWGVREGALAGAFALVGVPVADMVTVSILYGLTGPAIGLVYGVLSLFGRESVERAANETLTRTRPAGPNRDHVMRYYDRVASEWDRSLGDKSNEVFQKSRWRSLEPLLAFHAGAASAAELGVGTGVYIARTATMFREVLAIDFSQGMLDVLQRKLEQHGLMNVRPLRQDVCQMSDVPDASVDCAYCIGLFDNVDTPARVFSEVARILRPGGALIACTSNGRCPWYRLRDRVFGCQHQRTGRYLTADDVQQLAADAGLRFDVASFWGTVPPGMRSARLSRLLGMLEGPIIRTPLVRYLPGLTFRVVKT
jgi:ubiquinone/menaquinone biosynthesis C-methylase UbiE/uncharacterized membrane protein YbhN (UPF0104 family)